MCYKKYGNEPVVNIKGTNPVTCKMAFLSALRGLGLVDGSLLIYKFVVDDGNFIVEKTGKLKTHGKQIPRAHQRPNYTLLTINEIKKVFERDPSNTMGTGFKESHYRRRHFRELGHEKFSRNEDGSIKRIVIEPMWVGASEATVSGHKYKVRLEL